MGAASVELESGSVSIKELTALAVDTLRQAQAVEQQIGQEKAAKVGQYV